MNNLALAMALLQEHEAAPSQGLMSIQVNLVFWTLVIFGILYWILKRYAWPVILSAVEAREKALADALEGAKKDRDEAARILAEHRAQIEAARDDAQKFIADARILSEKSRADMLERTRTEQQELLERAKRDIVGERDKAIAQLRKEAVDLAIAGASKVIEENLDTDKNRKVVESFLASLSAEGRERKAEGR